MDQNQNHSDSYPVEFCCHRYHFNGVALIGDPRSPETQIPPVASVAAGGMDI